MSARKISAVERLERFWAHVDGGDGTVCWNWTGGISGAGYGMVSLGNRRHEGAHRYVWRILNGEIQKGLCVLHRCDNRRCVNPAHLFLGSKGDNARDCAVKFRTSKGKLSADAVRQIRCDPRSIRAIAREYGVNSSCITRVKTRRLYGHVS